MSVFFLVLFSTTGLSPPESWDYVEWNFYREKKYVFGVLGTGCHREARCICLMDCKDVHGNLFGFIPRLYPYQLPWIFVFLLQKFVWKNPALYLYLY